MTNLTAELIAKAKAAKSAEELLELAKENGIELTEEEAKTCFEQLHTNAAISDDELEAVAGGGSICDFFEDLFSTKNSSDAIGCSHCGGNVNMVDNPTITNRLNVTKNPTITNVPFKPDSQTSNSSMTNLPYGSDDKNKISFL
jgi:predicted ribosomally synthesized peptide with nif11-like leader